MLRARRRRARSDSDSESDGESDGESDSESGRESSGTSDREGLAPSRGESDEESSSSSSQTPSAITPEDVQYELSSGNVLVSLPSTKVMWDVVSSAILSQLQHNSTSTILVLSPNLERAQNTAEQLAKVKVDSKLAQSQSELAPAQLPIVTTPALLLQALIHGRLQLGTFSFIVLENAHQVRNDSPIGLIMRYWYSRCQLPPRVLAVTTSPIFGSLLAGDGKNLRKELRAQIEEVETLLGATAWSVPGPLLEHSTIFYPSSGVNPQQSLHLEELLETMRRSRPQPLEHLGALVRDDETACVEQLLTLWDQSVERLGMIGRELGLAACRSSAELFTESARVDWPLGSTGDSDSDTLGIMSPMSSSCLHHAKAAWLWNDALRRFGSGMAALPVAHDLLDEVSFKFEQLAKEVDYAKDTLVCVRWPSVATPLAFLLQRYREHMGKSIDGRIMVATDVEIANLDAECVDAIFNFDPPLNVSEHMTRCHRAVNGDVTVATLVNAGHHAGAFVGIIRAKQDFDLLLRREQIWRELIQKRCDEWETSKMSNSAASVVSPPPPSYVSVESTGALLPVERALGLLREVYIDNSTGGDIEFTALELQANGDPQYVPFSETRYLKPLKLPEDEVGIRPQRCILGRACKQD